MHMYIYIYSHTGDCLQESFNCTTPKLEVHPRSTSLLEPFSGATLQERKKATAELFCFEVPGLSSDIVPDYNLYL